MVSIGSLGQPTVVNPIQIPDVAAKQRSIVTTGGEQKFTSRGPPRLGRNPWNFRIGRHPIQHLLFEKM
jgi:hypothetical protein